MARGLACRVLAAAVAAFAVSCTLLGASPAFAGDARAQDRPLRTVQADAASAPGPHAVTAPRWPASSRVTAARDLNLNSHTLLRYSGLALLVIVVIAALILIVIRARRRRARAAELASLREMTRAPKGYSAEAEAARGRHAVAGPAGTRFGEPAPGWPDFTDLTTPHSGEPDPAISRSIFGGRRLRNPFAPSPGMDAPSADEPAIDRAPADAVDADGDDDDAAGNELPAGPPRPRPESGGYGRRKTSASPPWEPAAKPDARNR